MTTAFLFANDAVTTLAAPVLTTDTAINVSAGTGSLFPSPGASQQFALTLQDAATGAIKEICYCTNVTGDVLTVVRAQEGTAAHAFAAGDYASNYLTAGTAEAFDQGGGGSGNIVTCTSAALPSTTDLMAEGSHDWQLWNVNQYNEIALPTAVNRKVTGLHQIRDLYTFPNAPAGVTDKSGTWSGTWSAGDNQATGAAGSNSLAVYCNPGVGQGITLSAVGDLNERYLRLYMANNGPVSVAVKFTDGSTQLFPAVATGNAKITIGFMTAHPNDMISVQVTSDAGESLQFLGATLSTI